MNFSGNDKSSDTKQEPVKQNTAKDSDANAKAEKIEVKGPKPDPNLTDMILLSDKPNKDCKNKNKKKA